MIAGKENVKVTPAIISELARQSCGDLRKAITFLQSAHRLYGEDFDVESISVIAGVVPEADIKEVIAAIKDKSYQRAQVVVNKLVGDGYSAAQVLEQMHDIVLEEKDFKSLQKAAILEAIAEADFRLLQGSDEFLQLLNVCSAAIKSLS
jgi:replication factor C subunit 2/4